VEGPGGVRLARVFIRRRNAELHRGLVHAFGIRGGVPGQESGVPRGGDARYRAGRRSRFPRLAAVGRELAVKSYGVALLVGDRRANKSDTSPELV
jgi:hypothetical protein